MHRSIYINVCTQLERLFMLAQFVRTRAVRRIPEGPPWTTDAPRRHMNMQSASTTGTRLSRRPRTVNIVCFVVYFSYHTTVYISHIIISYCILHIIQLRPQKLSPEHKNWEAKKGKYVLFVYISHIIQPCISRISLFFVHPSYHTTHTTPAEGRAEKQCRRRGASSGQKTRRSIEGEDPAAAGMRRFLFFG